MLEKERIEWKKYVLSKPIIRMDTKFIDYVVRHNQIFKKLLNRKKNNKPNDGIGAKLINLDIAQG